MQLVASSGRRPSQQLLGCTNHGTTLVTGQLVAHIIRRQLEASTSTNTTSDQVLVRGTRARGVVLTSSDEDILQLLAALSEGLKEGVEARGDRGGVEGHAWCLDAEEEQAARDGVARDEDAELARVAGAGQIKPPGLVAQIDKGEVLAYEGQSPEDKQDEAVPVGGRCGKLVVALQEHQA